MLTAVAGTTTYGMTMGILGGVERVSMLDTLTATTYFAYGSDYTYEGGTGCSRGDSGDRSRA